MLQRSSSCLGALLAALTLVACSRAGALAASPAPPLPAETTWYNVSAPLNWSDLKGRAVLLDFFTPGCINCVHMLPVEAQLAKRFGTRLVIIGVDSPKFSNSATPQGLTDFITQHGITHPVLLDSDSALWHAWQVFAWPTLILVGPDGQPLKRFIGETDVTALAAPISKALSDAPPAAKLRPLPIRLMGMGNGALDAPGGIAVSSKWVAVSDTGHNRIVFADHAGRVKAVVGGCTTSVLDRPHGLTFHDGKLYVADTQGQRIRVVDPATQAISTLAGNGERRFVRRGQFAATKAALNSPWDVQWAQDGLYISMAGDHAIWRYAPDTKKIGPWAGSGREGLSDGDLESAEFAQSSGLDVHDGTLYVADPESSALRAVTLAKGKVSTLVGQGLFKFGLRNGAATQALLQHAEDVIWLDGSLYIADTFNNALRRLDLKTDRVTTIATGLKQPQALAALDTHTLLVTEAGGDRVVAVHLPGGKTTPWPLRGLAAPKCPATTPKPDVAQGAA